MAYLFEMCKYVPIFALVVSLGYTKGGLADTYNHYITGKFLLLVFGITIRHWARRLNRLTGELQRSGCGNARFSSW